MSSAKPLFSDQDRELIESLVFDTSLAPEFNAVSTSLYWEDELPEDITNAGMKVVRLLWIARSFVHRGLPFEGDETDPKSWRNLWQQATEEIPYWTGFKRLVLNKKDKEYFEQWLGVENPFD